MKFKAENLQLNTLQEGLKITVYIENEERGAVLENIHRFIDQPLTVDINIDSQEKENQLGQITKPQRRHIYALFEDFARWQGDDKEGVKKSLKKRFREVREKGEFSLANCTKELASEFIDWLVQVGINAGVNFSESPAEYYAEHDQLEKYMQICINQKKCCICGADGEIHHVDTIGMGNDRNKVDDSNKRKIALCREHHTEAHNIGWDSFKEKYHVEGVK